jgi:hypothetical protein
MKRTIQFKAGWTALALFIAVIVFAPRARAWNEDTHQNIVQLSYQVINVVDYEKNRRLNPNAPQPSVVPGILDAPAGANAAEWDAFLGVVAASRQRLGKLVIGAERENLDEHAGNILCAPPTGRRLETIDEFPFGQIATSAQRFNSSPAPLPPCEKIASSDYHFGGIYDHPLLALATGDGPHTGSMLGWLSAGVDSRIDDWFPVVVPIDAALNYLSAALNGGEPGTPVTDSATVALFPGLLAFVFSLLSFLLGPILSVPLVAALIGATFFQYHLPSFIAGPRDFPGSGHFINVQTPVAFGSRRIPSSLFDDIQGKDLTQAYYLRGATSDTAVMDSYDHYLLDAGSLGAGIDFHASFGPNHYQITDPDDGSKASMPFRGEDYWDERDFSAMVFTPVDNLAYYGWREWRGDPCKKVERLHWPLHALGDASAPHHVVGVTGLGHRPFEDVVQYSGAPTPPGGGHLSSQWTAIIHGDDPVAGKSQAHQILENAFGWSRVIRDFQQTHPGDIPVRQLVTLVAQKTLGLLHDAAAPTISCSPNACHFEEPLPSGAGGASGASGAGGTSGSSGAGGASGTGGTPGVLVTSIICDGTCTGFAVKPTCALGFSSEFDQCTVNEYIAVELSGVGGPMPAVLPPGLSHYYDGAYPNAGLDYYRKPELIAEQRKFVELGAGATLAFLAYAAETVPTPVPAGPCLCPDPLTLCSGECRDLTTDANNCGGCGVVCSAPNTCCGGLCVALQSDNGHCGGCDRTCAPAQQCQGGICACPVSAQSACGNICTDLATDHENCGFCQNHCAVNESCTGGLCPSQVPL